MSIITTDPNHVLDLPTGTRIRNVIGSGGDTIIIRKHQNIYLNYSRYKSLMNIQNNSIISWLDVCRHFAGDNGNCCICGNAAAYGGHIILGERDGGEFEHQRTPIGSNRVFLVPLCGRCNRLTRNILTTQRLTRAVHIFDYKRVYQQVERIIVIQNKVYIPRRHQNIIERQIRLGINVNDNNYVNLLPVPQVNPNIQGRQGQQGRQPQAGQARPIYWRNH